MCAPTIAATTAPAPRRPRADEHTAVQDQRGPQPGVEQGTGQAAVGEAGAQRLERAEQPVAATRRWWPAPRPSRARTTAPPARRIRGAATQAPPAPPWPPYSGPPPPPRPAPPPPAVPVPGPVVPGCRSGLLVIRGGLPARLVVEARIVALVAAAGGVARTRRRRRTRIPSRPSSTCRRRATRRSCVFGWGKSAHLSALGDVHELLPDLGRERASRDGDAVHAAHLPQRVRIADPDRRGQVRRVAVEPGVVEVVGRAGLTGGRAADLGARAGTGRHVLLEDLRDLVCLGVGEHALALGLTQILLFAVGEPDAQDRDRLVAHPARGEGRVRVGHLQGRHTSGQSAEPFGRIAVELRRDAHRLRGLGDALGAEVEVELREHGVVRLAASPAPGSSSPRNSGRRSAPSRGRSRPSSGRAAARRSWSSRGSRRA